MHARLASVQVLLQVIQHGRSLTDALNDILPDVEPQQRAFVQAVSYGCLRNYHKLDFMLAELLTKPLRKKDTDVFCLLLTGLYQLIEMRTPDHAAVSETVSTTKRLNKRWAKDLVNAVLRNFSRQQAELEAKLANHTKARYSHPDWLVKTIQQAWPDNWQDILTANNTQAPMSLRVNAQKISTDEYLQQLQNAGITAHLAPHVAHGITLQQACPVEELPGFTAGQVSVQDTAAQLAAEILNPQTGERILDACAAPGGKTAHILESQPELGAMLALDIEPKRLTRIDENLQRLGLKAKLICGDGLKPDDWWDGQAFDRILLDAPCSATGVIRRHPDIKLLRRPTDIEQLVQTQQKILAKLWPLLKPGGMLLYATCSILPVENTQQIQQFLDKTGDARLQPIERAWGQSTGAGQQIMPGEDEMDGFFYACLHKSS